LIATGQVEPARTLLQELVAEFTPASTIVDWVTLQKKVVGVA